MTEGTIRGSALPDRCPDHGAPVAWFAEPEVHRQSWMRLVHVARYDCGCLITIDSAEMGAQSKRELIVDA